MRSTRKFRLSLLAMLSLSTLLHAADTTGSIAGVIKDQTGAVAPGIAVTATNTGTDAVFHATTDDTGSYFVRGLTVGAYRLSIEPKGFKKFVANDIHVQVNETARVDIALQVGDVAQTVDVSGAVETVDTQSITLKTVVDQQRIENLPLNGRNPVQLMQLVAGVEYDPQNSNVTSGTTYPGVYPVSVNGGRANTTNYILDGAQNNDHYSNAPNPMPDPDALQEFSVQTNTFSAEFGRNVGGIVNAVTRSGTNDFHGSAFEYIRNNDLNATNFFAPLNPDGSKQDDGLKRNQFGATIGGPVLIPKIYNGKNRTFFFFSYQGTRTRVRPSTTEQVVPTNEQRVGNFSALGSPIFDPFNNGVPYPNNQIPASEINPVTRASLDTFIPAPAPGQDTISYGIPNNLNDDQYLVRIDHDFTDKNRFMARFFTSKAIQPGYLAPNDYFATLPGAVWQNTSVMANDAYTISPNLVNQVLFSYNRTNNVNTPVYPPKGVAALGSNYYNDSMPEIYYSVDGYFLLDTNDTNTFLREEYEFGDTVRWTKGKHTVSIGVDYGHGLGNIVNNYRANGYFTFDSAAPFTGNALSDFLIGKFYNLEQGVGEYKDTRFNIFSLFVQDSFRVTPRLTLDLGLRWDPFFPYTDLDGKIAAYRPGQQSQVYPNAPEGILFAGDPGLPPGGYSRAWEDLGPRVGFALDVFGNGSTALRGGYGIYYDHPNTISTNSQADQAPFGTVVNISGNSANSLSNPYAGTTDPFPASTNPPHNVQFVLPDVAYMFTSGMRNAQLQSWNLTLERKLPGEFVVRAAYAGSKGTYLPSLVEGDAAVYSPGVTTATTDQRRPLYPNFGSITLVEANGNSSYNALQLTLQRRFLHGFTLLANYTFSKSIDSTSQNKQTSQTATDPYDLNFDRGVSDFNQPQVFSFSGLWQLPIHASNHMAQALIGGWQLSSIVSLHSGEPFSVYSNVDNSFSGIGNDRADLIGNPYLSGGRSRGEQLAEWLNPAAFSENTPGTFGDTGRNMFTGPGFASTDIALEKEFHPVERLAIQFRAEAFNAFNRPNLMNPNNNLLSPTFMVISSAFDPRILQGAIRLKW
jgi:outer membrane receptor protein involved in Fe transport